MDAGTFAVQKLQTKERERGYNGFYSQTQRASWYGRPDSAGALSAYVPLTRRSGVLGESCPAINTAQ